MPPRSPARDAPAPSPRTSSLRSTTARTPKRVSVVVTATRSSLACSAYRVLGQANRHRRYSVVYELVHCPTVKSSSPAVSSAKRSLSSSSASTAWLVTPLPVCIGTHSFTGSGPGVFHPMYLVTAPIDLSLHTPDENCQPAADASS